MLGKDEFAIDFDIKNTTAAFDELAIGPESLLEPGSQTDRLRFVVSLYAVFD